MEELLELKELLHQGKVSEALLMVEELEEMSKADKLNKVFSYGVILLMHLIKEMAETRTTRSWQTSILNLVKHIQRTNQRRGSKGTYFTEVEILETLEDAYPSALRAAALEAFEGRYEARELGQRIDQHQVLQRAITLILTDP